MSIYIGDKEIKNLFVGGITEKDYSAIQGPASSGFHVPTIDERRGLKTIMDGLSLTTGDGWRINLHMPYAGNRNYSTADLSNQGSYGFYWSSSPYVSDRPDNVHYLSLNSSGVSAYYTIYRAYGLSVRCFKDSYETPTSSWTVVQGTLGSAGIFWNQSEGLISITDGTTGYTIMDKNLGANAVYNDGDALSESNCGKYYQWGNNYGFAWTGSVTTSTTPVNAGNYGPGNYYSGSTFIKTSSNYRYDWSSVRNDNLRGGVTGIIDKPKEAKAVYLGNTKVRESYPSLLTYEEIVAMATTEGQPYTNTITELNGNAEVYYNMLNDGGHFTPYIGVVYITGIDINRYVICYNYHNDGRFECIQREKS